MNEFITVFLFTTLGDYQTRAASRSIVVLSIPILCFFLYLLLNIRFPKPLTLIKEKVYLGNRALPTMNFLLALIIVVLAWFILMGTVAILASTSTHEIVTFGNQQYSALQKAYNARQYSVTEGIVHVQHAQPHAGHDEGDIVRVGDIEFVIDYFTPTVGYRQTIAYGGVLTEGTYARVFYVENSEAYLDLVGRYTILRIDIMSK